MLVWLAAQMYLPQRSDLGWVTSLSKSECGHGSFPSVLLVGQGHSGGVGPLKAMVWSSEHAAHARCPWHPSGHIQVPCSMVSLQSQL